MRYINDYFNINRKPPNRPPKIMRFIQPQRKQPTLQRNHYQSRAVTSHICPRRARSSVDELEQQQQQSRELRLIEQRQWEQREQLLIKQNQLELEYQEWHHHRQLISQQIYEVRQRLLQLL
jgi:hypothetical protein